MPPDDSTKLNTHEVLITQGSIRLLRRGAVSSADQGGGGEVDQVSEKRQKEESSRPGDSFSKDQDRNHRRNKRVLGIVPNVGRKGS